MSRPMMSPAPLRRHLFHSLPPLRLRLSLYRLSFRRPASTSSSNPQHNRKSITLTTDTGRVPWTSLSTGEKAIRSTQQTLNLGLVLLGIGLTVGVGYVLYLEVFSPSSKTAVFNRTVTRIRADQTCVDALVGRDGEQQQLDKKPWGLTWSLFGAGDRGAKIAAYGEGSWSRWARNRTIASNVEVDRRGVEHMHMHFYVAGPKAEGTVWVHMTRRQGAEWDYHTLSLDIKGQQRVWLENAEKTRPEGVKGGRMFGVKWW